MQHSWACRKNIHHSGDGHKSTFIKKKKKKSKILCGKIGVILVHIPGPSQGKSWGFFLKFFQTGSVLRFQGTRADYSCRQTFMEMAHVPHKRCILHNGRQVRNGQRLFSFFQSSPDLFMCVMLPATGKQKDRRKICYTFISEMRQTNNRACLFDCPVQLQHVYIFCIGTDTTEVGEGGG